MQQAVRVKRVVDAAAPRRVESETQLSPTLAYRFVEPYLALKCSVMSWPPGGICGFSSKG